ncbi:S46 family peptidase [Pontibacter sp. G13]|uniref:S46 family peptidase n=1 Tax=Pontibacter sp. G13 TaxID=3074898 RepID=UPI00288BD4D6|nr:S46 family peptidase [Pontibacter sp. G13]WNJ21495.1 S46 family peptidase [Pontibacter sp. G13]
MKKRSFGLLLALTLLLRLPVLAGEGMWIPILLGANEAEMQSMGMKMSAEDIYSVNNSSLKDAIVKFGGGCTGEIISSEGLLLTNHHCGFGQIRNHSSVENDLLKNGFWAMNRSEELTNPGLTVTFIVKIEDVTARILDGMADDITEQQREAIITQRSEEVIAEMTEGTHYEAEVKPFYYGNEFYVIVKEIFKDVRLVGAPPSSIGKFGGETDNWVWPRHNADFSLFRVYTGPDGMPAEYAPENIPLKPRHFLPISMEGIQENDFTMVFGFPARTQEYLPSYAVDQIVNLEHPTRIKLRELRLDVFNREMRASDEIRIRYASKESGVSNGYKKWKGAIRGLKRDQALLKKENLEAEFITRVAGNPEWQAKYGSLLGDFEKAYGEIRDLEKQLIYFQEAGYSLETVPFTARAARVANAWTDDMSDEDKAAAIEELRKQGKRFFSTYYDVIDREVTEVLLRTYAEDIPEEQWPEVLSFIKSDMGGDFNAYATYLFENSAFVDSNRYYAMLDNFTPELVTNDPAYALMGSMYNKYFQLQPAYSTMDDQISKKQRLYMEALREVFPEKTFFPDANFTLRVAYGRAEGMTARDGVTYRFYTTLDGVMEKYKPGDYEFDLPQKLIDLHEARDYGPYAQDGELRVAFIASNHTSGGNSGSPVINGSGELVGLNFDRNWEGTMSDINYDVNQCRNISVDARYILFIIDKFAGATHLVEEMKLVQ